MSNRPILLSRSEIDDGKWDRLVYDSRQSLVYGLSWYLDIVSPKWEALVWPTADDYQVLMPIPVLKKFGYRVVQQPLFCQYLGLFSKTELTDEMVKAFVEVLTAKFSYISSYSFNPHQTAQILAGAASFPKLETNVQYTHLLDLSKPFDEVFAGYSKDRKLNIKRASEWNWERFEDKNLDPILSIFRQHHENSIHGGVSPKAYELLKRLLATAGEVCDIKVIYAGRNGNYCAGVILMEYNGRVIYIFNAANEGGREGNARSWLLNKYFEENARRDLIFDFESPDVSSIAGFYESFGATAAPYVQVHMNDLPTPLKQFQRWRRERARSHS